jgi:hypothetical protein
LFQSDIEIIVNVREGYKDPEGFIQRIVQYGEQTAIKVSVTDNKSDNFYYKGLQFTIVTNIKGITHYIGDGGFVDWSERLLGSKKERMIISAIGLDRLLL